MTPPLPQSLTLIREDGWGVGVWFGRIFPFSK
jgi:hypothetical protein